VEITPVVTLALSLSVAVERVMEILKGLIPPLAKQQPNLTAEYVRCAILHFLSVLVGGLAAYGGHVDFFQKITNNASDGPANFAGYVVCGLLAAGGSAFWNHVLDIIKATKIKDESKAQTAAKDAGNQNPIPA
jgi:hypothetical protein